MASKNSTRTDFYVYLHRRKSDGVPYYVGKGKNKRAWETHNRSKYWQNITKKHGCIVEIVQKGVLEWYAFELEVELISLYGRENLCNLTDGGEGASGAKRSPEAVAKNIALHKGKKRSAESRARMSAAQKASPFRIDISGDKNPAKRLDVREKMRQPRPAMLGDKNPMKRKEVRDKLFEIMQSDAYKEKMSAAVSASRLRDDVVKKHALAVKKSFENPERMQRALEHLKRLHANPDVKKKQLEARAKFFAENGKKVLCVTNGMIFPTQAAAALWLKSNGHPKATSSRIASVIKGKRNQAYKMVWRYA